MKTMILSILFGFLLVFTVNADFLPEDNSDAFGLEYAESIAGFIPSAPKIDGKLDDWKYAVWVAFDSEKELLRGKGVWDGKDDLTMTWSTMYDAKTFILQQRYATTFSHQQPTPDNLGSAIPFSCTLIGSKWESEHLHANPISLLSTKKPSSLISVPSKIPISQNPILRSYRHLNWAKAV